MTRQRIALYCVVGIVAYVVALIATLPAAWVSRALGRASAEKLLVRDAAGTIWNGSARVYAREHSGPPLELGELRWKTAWTGLLTGKLVADVAFGGAGKPAHVEVSPFGVSVQALDVSLDVLTGRVRGREPPARPRPTVDESPEMRLLLRRLRRAKPKTIRLLNLIAAALEGSR